MTASLKLWRMQNLSLQNPAKAAKTQPAQKLHADQESSQTRQQKMISNPFSSAPAMISSAGIVQKKLRIGASNDRYEAEADAVADQVMRMPMRGTEVQGIHAAPGNGIQRKCTACEEEKIQRKPLPISSIVQRKPHGKNASVNPQIDAQIAATRGGGHALDRSTQHFMENRFGRDFSNVKVHTSGYASQLSQDLNARAFAVGNDIYFNQGQYQPHTESGKHLLAHELTHTVQQGGGNLPGERIQRYTAAERRAMSQRTITARPSDITLANARGFQPGDIVFRMGSTALGMISGQVVTHGGIYIGNGLIHDVVGFGNRNVRVGDFYNPALHEAADANIFRVIRFIGPMKSLILARLMSNIAAGNFNMPTDPVPFNLFSTSGDYRTATCLEYSHAQFLYAISTLMADSNVSAADKASLRRAYYVAGGSTPSNLIQPEAQRLIGNISSPMLGTNPGSGGGFGGGANRSISAMTQATALIGAASALATDVDSTRFQNRNEGAYRMVYPSTLDGSTGAWSSLRDMITGMLYDEVTLNTFTYSSFVNSTTFFRDVTPP